MIPAGFHVPRRTQVPPRSMPSLRIRVSHPLRIPFPWDSPDSSCHLYRRSYNPGLCPVWAPPLSLAATHGIDVSFSSSGYLDVSVPRVPLRTLWIHVRMTEVPSAGFPHSEISGSMDICSSPKLFAAYHVFHRLLVPRHPPCALLRLTFSSSALYLLKDGCLLPFPSVGGIRLHDLSCFLSFDLLLGERYNCLFCPTIIHSLL